MKKGKTLLGWGSSSLQLSSEHLGDGSGACISGSSSLDERNMLCNCIFKVGYIVFWSGFIILLLDDSLGEPSQLIVNASFVLPVSASDFDNMFQELVGVKVGFASKVNGFFELQLLEMMPIMQ